MQNATVWIFIGFTVVTALCVWGVVRLAKR